MNKEELIVKTFRENRYGVNGFLTKVYLVVTVETFVGDLESPISKPTKNEVIDRSAKIIENIVYGDIMGLLRPLQNKLLILADKILNPNQRREIIDELEASFNKIMDMAKLQK